MSAQNIFAALNKDLELAKGKNLRKFLNLSHIKLKT
jgi:hypothetical protein